VRCVWNMDGCSSRKGRERMEHLGQGRLVSFFRQKEGHNKETTSMDDTHHISTELATLIQIFRIKIKE
jgi:hypothetical protein